MSEPATALPSQSQGEPHFRWRGGGVSRIEGLSDGVFALALTLLVVKLEVPRDFEDLLAAFRQVPVFLLTFTMFGWVWYLHHQFHRRFGLEDVKTVFLNLVLLFVVLLYVYPLRFLAASLCQTWGLVAPPSPLPPGYVAEGLRGDQVQGLMLLYGTGGVALFGVMSALYRHAWSCRDALGLDPRERIIAQWARRECDLMVGLAVVSMLFAACGAAGLWQFLSGITYSFAGVAYSWSSKRMERDLAAVSN